MGATSALLFLQEAESRPRCRRLQLKDMIPTEMQRLTKYPLLLQSIGQNTGTLAGCPTGPALPRPTLATDQQGPGLGFTMADLSLARRRACGTGEGGEGG